MKYKTFSGQVNELEKKINAWLTPNMDLLHITQSTVSAVINDKTVPYTIISVFYSEKGIVEKRNLD
jgi:hypothetical protein